MMLILSCLDKFADHSYSEVTFGYFLLRKKLFAYIFPCFKFIFSHTYRSFPYTKQAKLPNLNSQQTKKKHPVRSAYGRGAFI